MALAGETPEEHKKTSNETVDDQIEEHSSGTGLVGERVDYLSDAQPDDEMKVSARHTDNGVDDGKAGNPHKPVCARLYYLFGAHAAQHQIVSRSCSLRREFHSASSHSHLS